MNDEFEDGQISALLGELRRDGYVFLSQFCEGDLLSRLRRVGLQQYSARREALGEQPIGIGSAEGYVEIVQRSPGRWDVPIALDAFGLKNEDLSWWPLVAAVLGDDAESSFCGVVSSEPGSPAQFWHADSPHETADHRDAHALNVMVALHELPLAMGPTECARGSHVLTNHLFNRSLVASELIYQHALTTPESLVAGTDHEPPERFSREMRAGSCLVFDDRLLHRGLANQSEQMRHLCYFAYRRKGYTANTHFESQRSLFDSQH